MEFSDGLLRGIRETIKWWYQDWCPNNWKNRFSGGHVSRGGKKIPKDQFDLWKSGTTTTEHLYLDYRIKRKELSYQHKMRLKSIRVGDIIEEWEQREKKSKHWSKANIWKPKR